MPLPPSLTPPTVPESAVEIATVDSTSFAWTDCGLISVTATTGAVVYVPDFVTWEVGTDGADSGAEGTYSGATPETYYNPPYANVRDSTLPVPPSVARQYSLAYCLRRPDDPAPPNAPVAGGSTVTENVLQGDRRTGFSAYTPAIAALGGAGTYRLWAIFSDDLYDDNSGSFTLSLDTGTLPSRPTIQAVGLLDGNVPEIHIWGA